jgi:anti-sigma factor RsiW
MREALVAYLYGEATHDEGRRLKSHLTECAACREEMAAFERVRAVLQQWQIDDLPVVRVEATRRRSALDLIRELFAVAPLWAKAAGAVAAAMLVLAVMGTEISLGRDGFSMRADLLGRGRTPQPVTTTVTNEVTRPGAEQLRAEVREVVTAMIAESERQQKAEWQAQLVSLESQIENMRSEDLARLAARLAEQRTKIKTLERDIDRREGLDLTDILFSELTNQTDKDGSASARGGE